MPTGQENRTASFAVYGKNNSAPIFKGSKTDCLKFMAHTLKEPTCQGLSIVRQ